MSEFFQTDSVVNNDICSTDVLKNIKNRIRLHHQLYETLPIKDKYWEYTLSNSFKDANFKCKWDPDSHNAGKDITVEGLKYERISCKSGMIRYGKRKKKITKLKISGFRTTALKTLDEKLNYIDGNHEDVVFSLSSSLFKSQRKYVLTIFVPPKFKDLTWTKKNDDYKSSKFNGVTASILDACSHQLWYELDYDCPLILEKHEIQL
jgi:hypothetical protein